jgi:hypothetical protein
MSWGLATALRYRARHCSTNCSAYGGRSRALKGGARGGQAVPRWARATLERHAADPRPRMSLAQLEAGGTGDALWDAMQRQLVLTGATRARGAAGPAARVPAA